MKNTQNADQASLSVNRGQSMNTDAYSLGLTNKRPIFRNVTHTYGIRLALIVASSELGRLHREGQAELKLFPREYS